MPGPVEEEEKGKHVNMTLKEILKVRGPQAVLLGVALDAAVWVMVNWILPGHITVIVATAPIIVQTGAL